MISGEFLVALVLVIMLIIGFTLIPYTNGRPFIKDCKYMRIINGGMPGGTSDGVFGGYECKIWVDKDLRMKCGKNCKYFKPTLGYKLFKGC